MILVSINWKIFMLHTGNEFIISISFPIIIVNPSNNIELVLQIFIFIIVFESDCPVMVEV